MILDDFLFDKICIVYKKLICLYFWRTFFSYAKMLHNCSFFLFWTLTTDIIIEPLIVRVRKSYTSDVDS